MVDSIAYLTLAFLCLRNRVHASSENFEGRIVNGEYVKIHNYPHAVFLEIMKSDGAVICGSSVVNQHFLITAGHCFSIGKKEKILAFAGHENLAKSKIVRETRSVIVHEKYDAEVVENDIALVYLPKELPLGNSVKRVILMRSFPTNSHGSIAGWGVINDITHEETLLLKAVTQKVNSHQVCSRVISGPGALCAGSTRPSDPRPAEGDSGSGLITSNYQLIGLLSYKDSSLPALPVYTNISYYYSWIQDHIRKKCLKN